MTTTTPERSDRLDDLVALYPTLFRAGKRPENSSLPAGWLALATEACASLQDLGGSGSEPVVIDQVKEKFGGLRIYLSDDADGSPAVRDILEKAGRRSMQTCMVCGKSGHPRRTRWVRTLCDEHA